MNSLSIQFTLLMTVIFLFGCSNSDASQEPESNFYALTVGNSWEYNWYGVNSEQNTNILSVEESISIVGTEEINSNLFYKFKRTISGNTNGVYPFVPEDGEHYEYYRDSLGFLVNEEGLIKFTNSTYDEFPIDSYDDAVYFEGESFDMTMYGKLSTEAFMFESEIGVIPSLEMITRFEYDNGIIAPANNHIYYADGIGLVSDDHVFIASEDNVGYKRILVSYDFQ